MKLYLKQIAINTENIVHNTYSKSSFFITQNQTSSRIITRYNPVIELDKNKNYEMALYDMDVYYSFPNIDATNNNFRYSPDDGLSWVNIYIPEGCYEVVDINNYIQRTMKENGHYDTANEKYCVDLYPNRNTLKSVLNVASNYKLDFSIENSIRSVLGFEKQIYGSGRNESENIVNITSISSLRITSDIIGASYSNGSQENIIYSFFPNVGPGYKIIEKPTNLIYLPITLKTISSMETKLTDQNGKLINLRGEELTLRFHVRQI